MTTPFELSAHDVHRLLALVDEQLRRQELSAAVFIVGGAAMAAAGYRNGRLTQDIDAITSTHHIHQAAAHLARQEGLPETWLNSAAGMWLPPLPAGVLEPPSEPGLRITYADDAYLFATKLIAQRAKDADDLTALARRLGHDNPTPAALEAHINAYYTNRDQLELILGTPDVDTEIHLLAQDAARHLNRKTGDQHAPPTI